MSVPRGPDPPIPAMPLAGHAYRAMTELVAATRGRHGVAPALQLGTPGGSRVSIPDRDWYDDGARADLVSRGLEATTGPAPLAWLVRSGSTDVIDLDLRWLAACRHGFARHRLDLPGLLVVTRHGWANVATGECHVWVRVRARGADGTG